MVRDFVSKSATFSEDRVYRFSLRRQWEIGKPSCAFIMLNPSTADESKEDPTVRRCIEYAAGWGYGALVVVNLFALRSTDPAALRAATDPVGSGNDDIILNTCRQSRMVVAAWGVHGVLGDRMLAVRKLLHEDGIVLHALAFTKGGHPRHPLYLKSSLKPVVYPFSSVP